MRVPPEQPYNQAIATDSKHKMSKEPARHNRSDSRCSDILHVPGSITGTKAAAKNRKGEILTAKVDTLHCTVAMVHCISSLRQRCCGSSLSMCSQMILRKSLWNNALCRCSACFVPSGSCLCVPAVLFQTKCLLPAIYIPLL